MCTHELNAYINHNHLIVQVIPSLLITPSSLFKISQDTMASKYHCFPVAFLILGIWAYEGLGHELSMSDLHEQWMVQHRRVYKDTAEKEQRFEIFKKNVEFIESFNNAEEKSYKLSVNKFADQTKEEFRAFHTGYRPSQRRASKATTGFMYENTTVPTSKDWRKSGAVTHVKDQGDCGE